MEPSITLKLQTIFKIMRLLFFSVAICVFIISCNKEATCVHPPITNNIHCIDSTLIDSTAMCITLWEPVCGCNDVTYSNSCFASISGVTSYVEGVCCD
jgi:hypothetical protein